MVFTIAKAGSDQTGVISSFSAVFSIFLAVEASQKPIPVERAFEILQYRVENITSIDG